MLITTEYFACPNGTDTIEIVREGSIIRRVSMNGIRLSLIGIRGEMVEETLKALERPYTNGGENDRMADTGRVRSRGPDDVGPDSPTDK